MTRTRIRRIGNSLGIVIPKRDADQQGLREGDEVDIDIRKARHLEDLWGILRDQLGGVDEINDLVDEGEDIG